MNGAIADWELKMTRHNRRTKIMMGKSHHFLRSLRKAQNSARIDVFFMLFPQNGRL